MQFTSLAYLGFFAAVFAVHWAVPQKARWAVCLAASAGFYALLGAPMLAVLALQQIFTPNQEGQADWLFVLPRLAPARSDLLPGISATPYRLGR